MRLLDRCWKTWKDPDRHTDREMDRWGVWKTRGWIDRQKKTESYQEAVRVETTHHKDSSQLCLLIPWVYSLCVSWNTITLFHSRWNIHAFWFSLPLQTHLHTQTRTYEQIYLYIYISPLFLLVLIAEAGTAECAKLFIDKRVFISKFTSNKCPICSSATATAVKNMWLQIGYYRVSQLGIYGGTIWELVYKDIKSQLQEKSQNCEIKKWRPFLFI